MKISAYMNREAVEAGAASALNTLKSTWATTAGKVKIIAPIALLLGGVGLAYYNRAAIRSMIGVGSPAPKNDDDTKESNEGENAGNAGNLSDDENAGNAGSLSNGENAGNAGNLSDDENAGNASEKSNKPIKTKQKKTEEQSSSVGSDDVDEVFRPLENIGAEKKEANERENLDLEQKVNEILDVELNVDVINDNAPYYNKLIDTDYVNLSKQELADMWDNIAQENPSKKKPYNQQIRKIAIRDLLEKKSEA